MFPPPSNQIPDPPALSVGYAWGRWLREVVRGFCDLPSETEATSGQLAPLTPQAVVEAVAEMAFSKPELKKE